ncbi:DcaP family trimeric outer membrane transporter [Hydrocarboniclastica marina]|uniref:DcaP family trimeric outer membrane transporter n=1 Tax=Hydrocarboniclastica marina TaxID=2259620 RepID=UPI001FE4689A|nr:DcaP family trimeric outer membrane transporter [Hydrocarboniclastica marina]
MKMQRSLLSTSIAAAGLPVLALLAAPAFAQQGDADVADLERRIGELEAIVERVQGQAPETDFDNQYLVREGKGIKIGGTTITFSGFIKADMIAGSNGDGTKNTYSVGVPRNFAGFARNDSSSWNVGLTARESRFAFGTSTEDVAGHTLETYLEMDFNDDMESNGNELVSNSYNPRLRQAYGSWNGWTAGQTYTTFTDLAVLPEIMNQGKMAAFIYVTQPQVRYTMAAPGGSLMMALENPEDGISSIDADEYDDQSLPDFVARYNLRNSYGMYSVSGMARRLEVDDDETWAGAASIAARVPTIGRDNVRLQYSYGALGRYMGLLTYPDVQLEDQAADEAKAFVSQGLTAAYQHFWTEAWRSNLVGSHTEAVSDGSGLGVEASTSVHASLVWSPHAKMSYGLEYAHWTFKQPVTRDKDEYQQVMLSAKYDF